MHPLEKKTLAFIQKHRLIVPGEIVLVAVSGGPDSMALMHLLTRIAGVLRCRVTAACLDHGLRPGEAEDDVAFVRQQAAELGIAFEAGKVDVPALAREKGLSREHAGRLLRYDFLQGVAERAGAARIAVAHTADDQAEEILLRLIRGAGRKGLAGMLVINERNIVRPFLPEPKATIMTYLAERGIACREDATNQDRAFVRNRVRLELLPFLEEHFNPKVRRNLRQTAVILADEEKFMAAAADRAAAEVIGPATVTDANGCPRQALRLGVFAPLPRALQRRVLEKLLWRMGCASSFRLIEALLRLAAGAETGAELHFAEGLRVRREKERLFFSYPAGRIRQRGRLALPGSQS